MDNAKFDMLCTGLGLTNQDLADFFTVNKRTAARWRTNSPIPPMVAQQITALWEIAVSQAKILIQANTDANHATFHTHTNTSTLPPHAYKIEKSRIALAAFALEVNGTKVNFTTSTDNTPPTQKTTAYKFTDTLNARRLALGLSVKELAEYIEVSTPTVSRWLNGREGRSPYHMTQADKRLQDAENWIHQIVTQVVLSGKEPTPTLEGYPGTDAMPTPIIKVAYAQALTALRQSSTPLHQQQRRES